MRLTEAEAFVRLHRESWQPGAKGYGTTVINFAHCVRILGDIEAKEVKPLHYATLVQKLKEEGLKPATINRIQSALSTVLNLLFRFELLNKQVPYTRLKEPRGRVEVYLDHEVEAMLRACDKLTGDKETVRDVILFASKTGARQGEILKLTFDDIDFTTGKWGRICFRDTKSGEDRVIPITKSLHEMLARRCHDRVLDEVFPIHKDTLLRRLRALQRMCGIPKAKVFHTFRHTAASQLFSKGAALPTVMHVLGHKQMSTTARYSHALEDKIEEALESL